MLNKKLAILVVLMMIAPIVLAACGPTPEPEVIVETVVVEQTSIVEKEGEKVTVVETVIVEKEVEKEVQVEVTATPAPVERMGGWLDTVIFVEEPDSDAAVTRLEVGDLDVYAYNIAEPDIAQRIFDSEVLVYETAYGNYNDLTFMPSTNPEFNDGRLNPFYSDRIREAMNYLIDRDYIAQEISGGLARPRFTCINYASKDSAVLADTIAAINLKYAHNPDLAVEIITEEMEALGAEMVDGQWQYNGAPVVITGLIRVEDEPSRSAIMSPTCSRTSASPSSATTRPRPKRRPAGCAVIRMRAVPTTTPAAGSPPPLTATPRIASSSSTRPMAIPSRRGRPTPPRPSSTTWPRGWPTAITRTWRSARR